MFKTSLGSLVGLKTVTTTALSGQLYYQLFFSGEGGLNLALLLPYLLSNS